MAIELETIEPAEFVAGDQVQWLKAEDPDRSIADGWVMSYAILATGTKIDITCTDNGDGNHLATILAAASAVLPAGTYNWQSYLTKALDRKTVDSGVMKVLNNFAALDSGYDGRSYWRITLANIEAVIQKRATRDQSSYTVNGRQLSRTPMADLLVLYDKAKANVAAEDRVEDQKNGLGGSNNIFLRY